MNSLQLFSYNDQNVRTVTVDNETWFVAADVARILGYSVASAMTRRLSEYDKGVRVLHTLGGEQQMSVISEPGLYVAIIGSQVEGARKFQRWVTHEVLPSIRRNGSYGVAAPAMDISTISRRELAQAIIAEADRADAAEKQLAIAAPKVEAYETFMSADNDWDVRDAAHMLRNDHGIDIGEQRLFHWLRMNGWIDRTNRPYQRKLEQDLLNLKISDYVVRHRDGSESLRDPQVRITPKGLEKIRRTFMQDEPVRAAIAAPKRQRRTLNP